MSSSHKIVILFILETSQVPSTLVNSADIDHEDIRLFFESFVMLETDLAKQIELTHNQRHSIDIRDSSFKLSNKQQNEYKKRLNNFYVTLRVLPSFQVVLRAQKQPIDLIEFSCDKNPGSYLAKTGVQLLTIKEPGKRTRPSA